jgi:hypothetical protein
MNEWDSENKIEFLSDFAPLSPQSRLDWGPKLKDLLLYEKACRFLVKWLSPPRATAAFFEIGDAAVLADCGDPGVAVVQMLCALSCDASQDCAISGPQTLASSSQKKQSLIKDPGVAQK